MKDPCPCNGCQDRCADPNCHATCHDRYIPWAQRQEERKSSIRKIKSAENDINGHKITNMRKIVKAMSWSNKR